MTITVEHLVKAGTPRTEAAVVVAFIQALQAVMRERDLADRFYTNEHALALCDDEEPDATLTINVMDGGRERARCLIWIDFYAGKTYWPGVVKVVTAPPFADHPDLPELPRDQHQLIDRIMDALNDPLIRERRSLQWYE